MITFCATWPFPTLRVMSSSHRSTPSVTATALSTPARILLGASLMLIAFNLRPLFSSLSVLLPDLIRETSLTSAGAGYLTTLPVICLGLFAPVAPRLSERIGPERTLLVVMALLAFGTAWRGFGDLYSLFLGTAMAGAGIAMGNVLLPSVVKRDFAHKSGLMMGLFTMALCGGAAAGSAFTLPLMYAFSASWQTGLAMWAIPAVIVLLVWWPQSLRGGKVVRFATQAPQGLKRDPLAWAVTFFMGLQSSLAYCIMGWAVPILRDRGLDGVTAGVIVSASLLVQVATSLVVPSLAVRCKDQRLFNVLLSLLAIVGFIGLVLAPLSTIWFWAVVQGIGQGGLFAIALTVIVLRSPDSRVAAHLSGMAQGVGYLLAAFGPLLIGVLHSVTGNFVTAAWLVTVLGGLAAGFGWFAGRNAHVKTT
jgi:CP family cyanate transporter-like MFS transporter